MFLLSPNQAAAAEHGKMIIVKDSVKWRKGVSGISGSVIQTSSRLSCNDFHGGKSQCNKINALDIREATDDVVRIKMMVDYINPDAPLGTTNNNIWFDYDVPGRGAPTSGALIADVGAHKAATAVQVCLNNDKIKGIRLWGVHVNKDASLGNNAAKTEVKRKNCKSNGWAKKVSCAKNKIITNMRFHYKKKQTGFSGISIQCGKIAENTPPSTNDKKKAPSK